MVALRSGSYWGADSPTYVPVAEQSKSYIGAVVEDRQRACVYG
jgi:hypothetical protein